MLRPYTGSTRYNPRFPALGAVTSKTIHGRSDLDPSVSIAHRHVRPLRRGYLPRDDLAPRHAGEPARLRPGQDAQPAQRQQLRAPLQLDREGRAGDPRPPADGVPLLRPFRPPLHEPGLLRADHARRRGPRRLHALPAPQHRHPDRFLRREGGGHRAAEHGDPRGRRHRAEHEGGHGQRFLQACEDGNRFDGERAAVHRGGDQDHHRHPRKQVSEPGVNPQLLVEGLTWFVVFLFSTTLHEAGHALAALKLGDATAYEGGQVSLNPLPHIRRAPVGMVLVPLVSFIARHWRMGWASAPYDPLWAHRYPKRAALMAAAGPAANLLLVIVAGVLIRAGVWSGLFYAPDSANFPAVTAATAGSWAAGAVTPLSILFS